MSADMLFGKGTMATKLRLLFDLRQQYEALKPDWSKAPAWAQWYAIDASKGQSGRHGYFYASEPLLMDTGACWVSTGKTMRELQKKSPIPVGIDWRLCKWQRPQVTA